MSGKAKGIAASVVVIGIGLYILLMDYLYKKRCSAEVEATIADVDVTASYDRYNLKRVRNVYRPVYEYVVNGKKYRVRYKKYTMQEYQFRIGEKVTIKYNPNNPWHCVANNSTGDSIWGIAILAFGLFLLLVSIFRRF